MFNSSSDDVTSDMDELFISEPEPSLRPPSSLVGNYYNQRRPVAPSL